MPLTTKYLYLLPRRMEQLTVDFKDLAYRQLCFMSSLKPYLYMYLLQRRIEQLTVNFNDLAYRQLFINCWLSGNQNLRLQWLLRVSS